MADKRRASHRKHDDEDEHPPGTTGHEETLSPQQEDALSEKKVRDPDHGAPDARPVPYDGTEIRGKEAQDKMFRDRAASDDPSVRDMEKQRQREQRMLEESIDEAGKGG